MERSSAGRQLRTRQLALEVGRESNGAVRIVSEAVCREALARQRNQLRQACLIEASNFALLGVNVVLVGLRELVFAVQECARDIVELSYCLLDDLDVGLSLEGEQ